MSVKWLRGGADKSPEEMAQIVDTLMSYPL